MKKISLFCIACLLLTGCTQKQEESASKTQGCDDDPICGISTGTDMSAYEGFNEQDNQFIEVPMNDFLMKMDAEATGIFYFGYATCPWCIEALPIMNDVAKHMNMNIYYIDKKAETSDETTTSKIEERLADVLTKDETGNPHLYVPEVIVLKEGKVVANHMGTVEGHDAHERKMNEDEQAQLTAIYQELFSSIADQADMSGYEGFTENKHVFVPLPMKDFLTKLDDKETGIFYIGYATCPWCIEAVPIMNEVAKEQEQKIYYIDKKASTSDDETIQIVEQRLSDILDQNEEGEPHLYVPEVIIVKAGKVVGHHLGTVENHDAHERKMNESEQKELKETYETLFSLIK